MKTIVLSNSAPIAKPVLKKVELASPAHLYQREITQSHGMLRRDLHNWF